MIFSLFPNFPTPKNTYKVINYVVFNCVFVPKCNHSHYGDSFTILNSYKRQE